MLDQQDRRRWHVKKEISLGDILAFVSAAVAVIYAWSTLDKRVAILESAALVQKAVDTKQDDDQARSQQRVDNQFVIINQKLDYLLERLPRSPR